MTTFAVDFDGTIHDPHNRLPDKRMGVPIAGAREAMQQLSQYGQIVIYTAESEFKHIAAWLDYFEIPYNWISNRKLDADYYIDDKAIRFTNWHDTLEVINKDLSNG